MYREIRNYSSMELNRGLYRLVVTVTCLVCLGFSSGMRSELDPLIKTYASSSQLSNENLAYSGGKLKDELHSLTYTEWDSLVIQSELPVMVMFTADWCGPCRVMVPILNKMDSRYKNKFKFYTVNDDYEKRIAARFNIRSLPTTLVFKGGVQVDNSVGAYPVKLEELIWKYM